MEGYKVLLQAAATEGVLSIKFNVEGEAQLTLDGETYSLGPGDFVGFPAGGPAHTMRNSGDVVLRYLLIGQRLAHDVTDYPERGKRLYRNAGHIDVVDIDAIGPAHAPATPDPE